MKNPQIKMNANNVIKISIRCTRTIIFISISLAKKYKNMALDIKLNYANLK